MGERERIAQDLERQILETHDRFTAAIQRRIPAMDLEQRERYFGLVSLLVGKLEDPSKAMKQVLREMVTEALPMVLEELSGP